MYYEYNLLYVSYTHCEIFYSKSFKISLLLPYYSYVSIICYEDTNKFRSFVTTSSTYSEYSVFSGGSLKICEAYFDINMECKIYLFLNVINNLVHPQ